MYSKALPYRIHNRFVIDLPKFAGLPAFWDVVLVRLFERTYDDIKARSILDLFIRKEND